MHRKNLKLTVYKNIKFFKDNENSSSGKIKNKKIHKSTPSKKLLPNASRICTTGTKWSKNENDPNILAV